MLFPALAMLSGIQRALIPLVWPSRDFVLSLSLDAVGVLNTFVYEVEVVICNCLVHSFILR